MSHTVQQPAPSGPAPGDRSPFARLTELLNGLTPREPVINLSVGEPRHAMPDFVGPVIASHLAGFGRYPAIKGTQRLREAAAAWLGRRFQLPRAIDPETEVLVLNGSREGLFLAPLAARDYLGAKTDAAVLMPNPFYPAYGAGARAAGCRAIYLSATAANGFLPDLDAIDADILANAVAFYIASPANPQGAVANRAYFEKLISLATRFGFIVLSDECYSEIYTREPPPSILEFAGPDFANVVAFQSLSKRSNLPGLRTGFVAGDPKFLARYLELRNVAAPQVPEPLQHVAAAAYDDEAHVEASRALYRTKFDLADEIIGGRFGYTRPAGGFCLWLDVSGHGGDVAVTRKLWAEAGLRVIPGSYFAKTQPDGFNPGAGYIRVAMVQDTATTTDALQRLVATLGSG